MSHTIHGIGICGEVKGWCTSGSEGVKKNIGVHGRAIPQMTSDGTCNSINIGVLGTVDSAWKRIAVAGLATGTNFCSSISLLTGIYAGYFDGSVKVTNGTLSATLVSSSDMRLKKNVLSLGSEKVLDKLMLLKPIAYNFKQVEVAADSVNAKGEKVNYTVKRYDEKAQEFQKKHYGLSAQELQKVYPDLVYEDGDGYLSINYTGLIPLLLQAVQEQQATIAKQQAAIEELQKRLPDYGIISSKTASAQGEQLTK
jgi:hypothetical protein